MDDKQKQQSAHDGDGAWLTEDEQFLLFRILFFAMLMQVIMWIGIPAAEASLLMAYQDIVMIVLQYGTFFGLLAFLAIGHLLLQDEQKASLGHNMLVVAHYYVWQVTALLASSFFVGMYGDDVLAMDIWWQIMAVVLLTYIITSPIRLAITEYIRYVANGAADIH